jgi:hypothetical protein
MAILANVKQVISDIVFPEIIKVGMYSSFLVKAEGRFDYWAKFLEELQNGEYLRP